MTDRVTLTESEGVAHVELSRPEKINALDADMFAALAETGDKLRKDKSLRAVVLSGRGKGFSAGLDVASFGAMMGDGDIVERMLAPYPSSPANHAQQIAWTWTQVPVPVIAAVHGVCYGGGLQIALGADIRVVAPDAKLSIMEIKWGLVPDMSGPQRLQRLLRPDQIKALTFTGRIVSGEEAVTLGLATETAADPLAAAQTMARTIAKQSPDAIRAAKRLIEQIPTLSVAAGLALEAQEQQKLIGSPNQMEAVMANMQKREPSFGDPS